MQLTRARIPAAQDTVQGILGRIEELAQERAELTARLRTLDADVATLRRAAEILAPGSTPRAGARRLGADTPDGLAKLLGQGRFAHSLLETLREAAGPLTAGEAGGKALERLGHAPDALPLDLVAKRALTTLRRHAERGVLRSIAAEGQVLRWEVAR